MRETYSLFTMFFYLVFKDPLQVLEMDGITMGSEQNIIEHQTKLFISGSLQLRHSGLVALDFFEDVPEHYGVDEDRAAIANTADGVTVPRISFQLSALELDELKQTIDPLENCQNYGIDIYLRVITYCSNL